MNNEEGIIVVSASPIVFKNAIVAQYFKSAPEGHTTIIHYSIFNIHYSLFR